MRKAERNKKEYKPVTKPKKKENISQRDLEDLMGTRRVLTPGIWSMEEEVKSTHRVCLYRQADL